MNINPSAVKSAKGRPDWEIREIAKSDDNPRNQEVGNSEIRSDAHAGRHSLYNGKQNAFAVTYITYSCVRVLVDSPSCKWYQFLISEKKVVFGNAAVVVVLRPLLCGRSGR